MHKGAYKPKNDIGKYKKDLYNNIESEEAMQENSNITEENEIEINNCGFLIYPIADSIINDLQYIKKEEENGIYEGKMKSDEKYGYGIFTYKNGEKYLGELDKNQKIKTWKRNIIL